MPATLRVHQERAARHLADALGRHKAAVDASDTGVGKTYTACGVARLLSKRLFVVCPKAVRPSWAQVARDMEVATIAVETPEKLKYGNTPWVKKKSRKEFEFRVPADALVVWDEAQTAGGPSSQNQALMATLGAYPVPVLLASATLADSPLRLRAPGFLLGLHDYHPGAFAAFCRAHGCFMDSTGRWLFATGPSRLDFLAQLHRKIFPERGVRIRISDLGDAFPEGVVRAMAYDLEQHSEEIQRIYDELDGVLRNPHPNPMAAMTRARQRTELLKVPLLRDMAGELAEEGKSVIVFVSYNDTIRSLQEAFRDSPSLRALGEPAVIWGEQSGKQREAAIADFQADRRRLALVNLQAGGVGISLHDLHGNHPRAALISPSFSALHVKQALGRHRRDGSRTPALSIIVFAAGTIEEKARDAVARKLNNIDLLNDGDLSGLPERQEAPKQKENQE